MNKNILRIAFASVLCLGLASCSESFLDVESKTESTTGNFYKTENDAERALNGCYDGWQCTVSNGPTFAFYVASEMMSDECYGGTGNTDATNTQVIDRFDLSRSPSDVNLYNDLWGYYYAAVFRCNSLIQHEADIKWNSEASKGTIMGQCRALRAICYFDMVRLWGNIPLLTQPTNENLPQTDSKEVYKLIIEDLKYAAENIPANAFPKSEADKNDGRITCYAAKALLARVYLYYTGYYGTEPEGLTKAEALQGLEDIISSKEYKLVSQFKNLWPAASTTWSGDSKSGYTSTTTYAGNGNSETILAQKFNNTSDYNGNADGNSFIVFIGIRGGNFIAPYGQGWGACTVNAKMTKVYENGDTRKTASIIDLNGEGFMANADYQKSGYKDQREYTGYAQKKYTPMSKWKETNGVWSLVAEVDGQGEGNFQISQDQDFIVMRYADVLLMAAELGSPNAQTYMNMVRQRAFTDDKGQLSSRYTELTATKDNIMQERMREFAFEGQRYWDLLRQGVDKAASIIAESNTTVYNGGTPGTLSIDAENIKAKKGLSQIPQNQITLSNGVLKQNAGW